jgi:hypothetical protein
VNDVHVVADEQVWLVTGLPPVHPEGDDDVTVRVCVPLLHVPHAE